MLQSPDWYGEAQSEPNDGFESHIELLGVDAWKASKWFDGFIHVQTEKWLCDSESLNVVVDDTVYLDGNLSYDEAIKQAKSLFDLPWLEINEFDSVFIDSAKCKYLVQLDQAFDVEDEVSTYHVGIFPNLIEAKCFCEKRSLVIADPNYAVQVWNIYPVEYQPDPTEAI